MRTLTLILTLGYAATCIFAGLLGIVAVPAEMRQLYNLDPYAAPGLRAGDLMGQFSFMKATELGFGLFVLARLGAIVEDESERRIFTIIVAAGLCARLLAWMRYGAPSGLFLFFMALEALLLLALLVEGDGSAA